MSLFPAYAADTEEAATTSSNCNNTSATANTSEWLQNSSYLSFKLPEESTSGAVYIDSNSDSNCSFEEQQQQAKERRKRKQQKHKKSSKRRKQELAVAELAALTQFTGDEDYFEDKQAIKSYKHVQTLYKPACPRYNCKFKGNLGLKQWHASHGYAGGSAAGGSKSKRYYQQLKQLPKDVNAVSALDENEYTLRLGRLNRKNMEAPHELEPWLEQIELQARNPYKWSRRMLAERQIELAQRALNYHPRCEQLFRIYINCVNDNFPSFEVNKMLERLLDKYPYNYVLWTGRIMAVQGSLARCTVPDVMYIYKTCMQKMHQAQRKKDFVGPASDEVIIKLFNNCALFLRQAGLYEQFIALLKLALELNVINADFKGFMPKAADEQTLIEYEEVIVKSGLPMNEIWLRVEKLRQCFNFLPYPVNAPCTDTQRIVFNEDICHYIYPLESNESSFFLILLVLRLLKVPFVQCDGLAQRLSARVQDMGDSDAIEDALAICLRSSYALPLQQQNEFFSCIYGLCREMAVGPSFLQHLLGHEIYINCISDMLLSSAAAYTGIDERRRNIFALLWCRFERLLLMLQKCSKKLTADTAKAARARFKAFLKQTDNRNVLNLYTEFVLYEYETSIELESTTTEQSWQRVQQMFENILTSNAQVADSADFCHACVTYAEILIGRNLTEEAERVLVSFALGLPIKDKETISGTQKVLALQKIHERLECACAAEENIENMLLEQYFVPDLIITLVKAHSLLQYLIGRKQDALKHLENLLKRFQATNERQRFLREHTHAQLIQIILLKSEQYFVPNNYVCNKVFEALKEFPRNLTFALHCCMLSAPWYKIRAAILQETHMLSIVFLIALTRYRFLQISNSAFCKDIQFAITDNDLQQQQLTVRNRILNIFKTLSSQEQQSKPYIRRNALFWRLYLRCLSSDKTPFETSKECLLKALDECPWSKALYLDGATYVPQELTNLQDLIIEKQLRMYALPEELAILRE